MYKVFGGRRNGSSSHLTLATKKINTPKDSENILVTNTIYYKKRYLIFTKNIIFQMGVNKILIY